MTTEILTKRILNYSEMQQTNDYTQGDSDVILFHIYATFFAAILWVKVLEVLVIPLLLKHKLSLGS